MLYLPLLLQRNPDDEGCCAGSLTEAGLADSGAGGAAAARGGQWVRSVTISCIGSNLLVFAD
ncbi:MAG TPA: hypothetical protein VHJ78_11090 [Actinomycetota bacterium]|nr:hypothetical protein [Actinomycetota bacterium]